MAVSHRNTVFILASILLAASSAAAAGIPQGAGNDGKSLPAASIVHAPIARQTQDAVRKESEQPTAREQMETRAAIFMARKQYSEACSVYLELLKQEPRNAYLLNRVGVAYQQQMMLGMAKRYYERALKADPHYASARNNLGSIHYGKGKYKQAAEAFEKALKIDPEMPTTLYNLGNAYFHLKKYDESLSAFRRAVELDPVVFERRSGPAGSILQNRSVEDRASYFFFLAKFFAGAGDAERCAKYLLRARDEGQKDIASVAKDPAFSKVINNPLVQEVLQPNVPIAQAPKP